MKPSLRRVRCERGDRLVVIARETDVNVDVEAHRLGSDTCQSARQTNARISTFRTPRHYTKMGPRHNTAEFGVRLGVISYGLDGGGGIRTPGSGQKPQ